MKLRFKKEDIGLYFACMVVGGGVGLLAGAFIGKKRSSVVLELTEDLESSIIVEDEVDDISEDEEYDKEMLEFIDQYAPTQMQIQMIQSGVTTIDTVKDSLITAKTLREPYDYSKHSASRNWVTDADKPDLESVVKLPEDHGVIEGRFTLSSDPPDYISKRKIRQLFFDPADEGWFEHKGTSYIPLPRTNNIMSTNVQDLTIDYLQKHDYDKIYVFNTNTAKCFVVQLVTGEFNEPNSDVSD